MKRDGKASRNTEEACSYTEDGKVGTDQEIGRKVGQLRHKADCSCLSSRGNGEKLERHEQPNSGHVADSQHIDDCGF